MDAAVVELEDELIAMRKAAEEPEPPDDSGVWNLLDEETSSLAYYAKQV
jgi:hypothetical protein